VNLGGAAIWRWSESGRHPNPGDESIYLEKEPADKTNLQAPGSCLPLRSVEQQNLAWSEIWQHPNLGSLGSWMARKSAL